MAIKQVFTKPVSEPVNSKLEALQQAKEKAQEIQKEAAQVIEAIRSQMEEVVVVFVDMVDSTKYKTENASEPEKWILRVQQFSEVIAVYVNQLGGDVVKYIGDEVMAIFRQNTAVNDALSFVQRIEEIESALKTATGEATQIKVALDKGRVFLVKYEGHNEVDPQGTPVDRCARISKYAKPGTVVTSFEFVKDSSKFAKWSKIGTPILKGIGETAVYQLGEPTIKIVPMVDVEEAKFKALQEDVKRLQATVEELTLDRDTAIQKNYALQEQITSLGNTPSPENSLTRENEELPGEHLWAEIEQHIEKVSSLIGKSRVNGSELARILFFDRKGQPFTNDRWNDRTCDASFEAKYVQENPNGSGFVVRREHPLMAKLVAELDELEPKVQRYDDEYRNRDDGDLFEYSLDDPEFWAEKMGYPVT